MERSARTQRTLSKQAEFDEDDEVNPALSAKKEQETEIPNENSTSVAPQLANNLSLHRSRSHSKVKLLVRSHAVREETSPPPDPPPSPSSTNTPSVSSANINNNNLTNNNNLNGNCLAVTVTRHKLKREGSSQGSMDSTWSSCLSRGSSIDQYTDSSGVDLEQFIAETLNRNQKDRMLLLKIEHELVNLVKDSKRSVHKFPSMSSYQRMLVHRVAAYFGMDHNVDPSGHQVIVNKTKATRLPDTKFCELVRDDLLFPEEPRRSILKRDSSSFDETSTFKSPDRQLGGDCRRSKSFEEREEEYEKARKRIFNREHGRNQDYSQCSSQDEDDVGWPGEVQPWTSSESENLAPQGNSHKDRKSRMLKVESYESKDTLRANSLKLSISKSFSFGGYDQSSLNTRILTKQDSGSSMSSRLSPSSSGYKSQRSDITLSATPSPSATPNLATQLSSQSRVQSPEADHEEDTPPEEEQTVMWAVTSMADVPPGSVLINPQTGQPYTNSDGSIYHFDPENPPKMSSEGETQSEQPSVKQPSQSQSDSHLKKKPSSKHTHTTPQTSLPSCTEPVQTSAPVVFCNKSSHNLSPQDAEPAQISSKNQSNIPQLVKSLAQPVQTQASATTYVPYHPVPQHCYPAPAPAPASAYPTVVFQPPGQPSEGLYSASPQQPLVYTPSPVPIPGAYEQRVTISDGHSVTQDLNNYLMSLSIGDGIQNVGDNRSIIYWPSGSNTTSSHPPAHVSQGHNQSLPVFYPPPTTPHNVGPRYPSLLNGYTPMPTVLSMDRPGGGFVTPAAEWNTPAYPQSVHMYYNPQCSSAGHNSIPSSSVNNYCNNTNTGPSGVLIQFPPPTNTVQPSSQPPQRVPPSPSTQQPNMCPQYTMYSNAYGVGGCYPLHYTHPPMMHPPNLQLGSRSSPPLRTYGTNFGRSRSPGMRERSAVLCPGTLNLTLPEKSVHSSSPIRFANVPTHTHMPFYVTRLLSGDVRLMGNNNHRIGFSLPTNTNSTPPSHIRKARSKIAVVGTSGSPIINVANHSQPGHPSVMPAPGYMLGP